jgi:hypothetical protein
MQRSPASITLHFELSTMIGTRAMSVSAATRLRKCVIAFSPSSIPSSKFTSMIAAPPSTCCRATVSAWSNFPSRTSFANFGEPVTLVRSPISVNGISGRSVVASRPAYCVSVERGGSGRGATPRTASAMHLICSGVFPQQPPTMFIQPRSAKSRISGPMSSGNFGKPVGESGSGRPAFG